MFTHRARLKELAASIFVDHYGKPSPVRDLARASLILLDENERLEAAFCQRVQLCLQREALITVLEAARAFRDETGSSDDLDDAIAAADALLAQLQCARC